jgi:arylsulfatase A-like enzyme
MLTSTSELGDFAEEHRDHCEQFPKQTGGGLVHPTPTPNFLIIITDQHRIDTLAVYGSKICQTPSLDRLAESGVRFNNAYSVCALCSPARASIYTGVYPHRHGMVVNEDEFSDEVRLISQGLREQGYVCGFVGKWHCGVRKLPRDFGFEGMNVPGYGNGAKTPEYRAFLQRNNLQPGKIVPLGTGWHTNTLLCGKLTSSEQSTVPYFLAEQTIELMTDYHARDVPFLLFCNFWEPHAPYLPAEPYASMYDPQSIPPWGNFYDDLTGKPNLHRRYRDAFLGEGQSLRRWEEWSLWVATYFGFVTMIDAQIGRILDALNALNLAENTVVIFTTDHGDHVGAHGGIHDKDAMMYQETYHIPFLLRVPGMPAGTVIEQPITNMDIMPTILDLAGADPRRQLDGRSLVPLVRDTSAPWEQDVLCVFNGHHTSYQSRMVTDGNYKYVFNAPDIDEFYDLKNDPWELCNLITEESQHDRIAHFRSRLLYWVQKSGDPLTGWIRNLFALRPSTSPAEYTPYRD